MIEKIPTWAKIAALLIGAGFALRGAWEFVQEAPAIVSANASHIRVHHDSIVDLAVAAESWQEHAIEQDTVNRTLLDAVTELQRTTDYLACWRGERERLRDDPSATVARDCEQELLERRP